MANANWIVIRNEYINTDISMRKLAEKHKVSFNTLKARASKEKWAKEKEEQHHMLTTEIQQKTAEKIVDAEVDRITKLLKLTDDAQEKIEVALGQLDMYIDLAGKTHRSDMIDVARLKKLVAALKDIKEIIRADDREGLDRLDAVLSKIEGNI